MIFITGASSGIGQACAKKFAGTGAGLVLVARRRERLESLAAECRAMGAREVHVHTLDLMDLKAVEDFFNREGNLLSRVTVLVNNAGLARGLEPFQKAEWSGLQEMLQTNLVALIRVTQLMLPHFLNANEGHIIQLGSVAGHYTYPKGHVYCATKAAVRSFSEALRLDLNGTAIRVTEISPGMVETEFSEVRLGDAGRAKQVYAGMTPLVADDIAETLLWVVQRPKHVNVQEIVLYPTDQASPTVVARR